MGKVIRCILLVVFTLAPSAAFAQSRKPVVAIYQMDDLANSGQAKNFSVMIETAIESTSKFRVIEREHLDRLVGEQARAKSGLVTSNTPGRIGGFEGADFLIYGTITNVSVTNKSDLGSNLISGLFSGKNAAAPNCNNAVVTVSIDIKITDARSGEVKYVTRINETQKSPASCGSAAQIDTSLLMRSAADKVATGLVTTIYPIQIAAVQSDGVIVLNYGEGAVTSGSIMAVFAKGQEIRDPATGEVLAHDEQKLGLIQVTDIAGRVSKATVVSPFLSPPVVGAIVRLANAADIQALKSKRHR